MSGQKEPVSEGPAKKGLWQRLKGGLVGSLAGSLAKTRGRLAEGVGTLFLGRKAIDADVLDELESALLQTDVGVPATARIMESLTRRVKRNQLADTVALHAALREELIALLSDRTGSLAIDTSRRPFVILFVGVNGAGKTTTIGKLARQLKGAGYTVTLAAGDTFRAAAVEQLVAWGERSQIPVIAQGQGADSASVIFDAVQAGRARGADVVIADTAGRLQAKANLMEELAKIKRVLTRLDPSAPHEVLLVLDGGVGQNALSQVREFDAAVGLTGLVVTKLDGTARAGVLFAIAHETRIPVCYIGVGEGEDDLRPFEPAAFVDALLARDGAR
jgi:fused signal recognition particle receptor